MTGTPLLELVPGCSQKATHSFSAATNTVPTAPPASLVLKGLEGGRDKIRDYMVRNSDPEWA